MLQVLDFEPVSQDWIQLFKLTDLAAITRAVMRRYFRFHAQAITPISSATVCSDDIRRGRLRQTSENHPDSTPVRRVPLELRMLTLDSRDEGIVGSELRRVAAFRQVEPFAEIGESGSNEGVFRMVDGHLGCAKETVFDAGNIDATCSGDAGAALDKALVIVFRNRSHRFTLVQPFESCVSALGRVCDEMPGERPGHTMPLVTVALVCVADHAQNLGAGDEFHAARLYIQKPLLIASASVHFFLLDECEKLPAKHATSPNLRSLLAQAHDESYG